MNRVWAVLLIPIPAGAGVVYDVAIRSVDQTNLALVAPAAAASTSRCRVEAGNVRIGAAGANLTYLFKDRILYVVDAAARTVHVLKHATSMDVAAHYAQIVDQLESAASAAPPEDRAAAVLKAADMKAVSDRLTQSVVRDYRLTARFESVDGRACRVWEESENGAKRLELCVAPVASVPGGAEILGGLKTLSRFREGAQFAFGVDFGLSDWWTDFARFAGVPLLIRQYKYDTVVSETLFSGMRIEPVGGSMATTPDGFGEQEGPDYVQWYLR